MTKPPDSVGLARSAPSSAQRPAPAKKEAPIPWRGRVGSKDCDGRNGVRYPPHLDSAWALEPSKRTVFSALSGTRFFCWRCRNLTPGPPPFLAAEAHYGIVAGPERESTSTRLRPLPITSLRPHRNHFHSPELSTGRPSSFALSKIDTLGAFCTMWFDVSVAECGHG